MKQRRPTHPPAFVAPLMPINTAMQRCPVPRARASVRFLIVRVGSHGDILMGTPLLTALRQAHPDAHLTWLVERSERDAIEANPYIDEVLLWDSRFFRRLFKPLRLPLWTIRALQCCAELRRRRYDVLISFQPEEWPLLLRGAAAPVTIGVFDTFREFRQQTQTSPRAKLYSHAFTHDDLPAHRTDQYLLPLRALKIASPKDRRMQMGFTTEDVSAAAAFLAEGGIGPREDFVVLAPMTTWASRCWDGERYAQLGDALQERGYRVVMVGSAREEERAQTERIAAQMRRPPVLALGCLSFRQMAALIARASCVVSGDTGPMHVAAAVGTPYVALFGPTPVDGRAPLAGRGITLMHPVPCGPCDQEHCRNQGDDYLRCMRLISVAEALEATLALLPTPAICP